MVHLQYGRVAPAPVYLNSRRGNRQPFEAIPESLVVAVLATVAVDAGGGGSDAEDKAWLPRLEGHY